MSLNYALVDCHHSCEHESTFPRIFALLTNVSSVSTWFAQCVLHALKDYCSLYSHMIVPLQTLWVAKGEDLFVLPVHMYLYILVDVNMSLSICMRTCTRHLHLIPCLSQFDRQFSKPAPSKQCWAPTIYCCHICTVSNMCTVVFQLRVLSSLKPKTSWDNR